MKPLISSTHTHKYAHKHKTIMHGNTPRHTFEQRRPDRLHNSPLISCFCLVVSCLTLINYPQYPTRSRNYDANCPIRKLFCLRFLVLPLINSWYFKFTVSSQQLASEWHPFINLQKPAVLCSTLFSKIWGKKQNGRFCALMKVCLFSLQLKT